MAVTPSPPIVRTLALAPDLNDLARGREFIGRLAREAGFPEDRVFDITVASDEAMANAIEHAPVKGQVEATVTVHADRFEVQVEGPGEFQAPRRLGERPHRGLGLPLMAKLADHLALYSGPRGGTLVGLTFYRSGAEPEEEPLPPAIRGLVERNAFTAAIAENVPVGICVLAPDLRYRWANQTYHSYLDEPFRSSDLTGVLFTESVPALNDPAIVDQLLHTSRTGVSASREDHWEDGAEQGSTWWRQSMVALRGERDRAPYDLLLLVVEETELKRGQARLERDRVMFRGIAQIFQEALSGRSEEYLGQVCLEVAKEMTQSGIGLIAEIRDDGLLHDIAVSHPGWDRCATVLSGSGHRDPATFAVRGLYGRVIMEGGSVLTNRPASHPASVGLPPGHPPLENFLGVTLRAGGRVIGLIAVGERASGYGPEQQESLEALSPLVVEAFQRKRAEQALRDSRERFAYLYQHSLAGAFSTSVGGHLLAANNALAGILGYASKEQLLAEVQDVKALYADPGGRSKMLGRLAESGGALGPTEVRVRRKDGSSAWLLVVMTAVLEPGGEVGGYEGTVLDLTEQKRLEEELRQREEKARRILERAPAPVFQIDFRVPKFVSVNDLMCEQSGYSREELLAMSPLALLDGDSQERLRERLRMAAAGEKPNESVDYTFIANDGRELAVTLDVSFLYEEGKPVGALVVGHDVTERSRMEEELRESEERYRELAEVNERLYRQQLDIAENLQLALLHIPSEIGPVRLGHLYRSATESARVGGDFYDVFEVRGGNIVVLIGDVAGHGIQAARTATLVKDVVHAFTHQSLRTNEVLRRTNALLIEKDLPGFVTVFLGILDKATGRLRYSTAGHPATLLRRASGEVERLAWGSSPLGVYPDASWKPRDVNLDMGDLLILYTDGVIEARHGPDLYGEERLEQLVGRRHLSPQRLVRLIHDDVLTFAGGNLEDDLAVLAVALNPMDEPREHEIRAGHGLH